MSFFFRNSDPTLPASDPDPEGRAEQLAEARQAFRWDHDYLSPLALIEENGDSTENGALNYKAALPDAAQPTASYMLKRGTSLLGLGVANLGGLGEDTYTSLDDYISVIEKPLEVPEIVSRWREDAVFAWQRLAGCSPVVIHGIRAIPDTLAVDEARLRGVLREGLTLHGELEAGNIFLCDYSMLVGIGTSTDDSGTRQMTPCLALYHVDRSADERAPLMPLAIQLSLTAAPSMVFTPDQGSRWLLARMVAQCADVTYHEMGPHLLRTHFMQETVAVALWRNLSDRHPLHVLLMPHTSILLFNNYEGRKLLINEGGAVDSLMAGGVASGISTLLRDYLINPDSPMPGWNLMDWDLPKDIERRAVEGIPDYPFRDDGMLLWEAIHDFVTGYVDLYYTDDGAVAADSEVQAWAAELRAKDGGRIRMVPGIRTRKHLSRLVTAFIFSCSALHSAVNFPQYDCLISAVNMPLALYAPVPADLQEWTDAQVEDYFFKLLPPPDKTVSQLNTIEGLTSYHHDQLGMYDRDAFTDDSVAPLIERFQARLSEITDEINHRNEARLIAYTALRPDNVLNSTSI